MKRAWPSILVFVCIIGLLGCSKESEKVVELSKYGKPHCPYCGSTIETILYTDGTKVDKEEIGFCMKCRRKFRWTQKLVICLECKGRGMCPVCKGAGKLIDGTTCWRCEGDGICDLCRGTGEIEYGQSSFAEDRLEKDPHTFSGKYQKYKKIEILEEGKEPEPEK